MGSRVYVINPNASDAVTAAIKESVAPFAETGVQFTCLTSPEGPPAIETHRDVACSIAPMLKLADSVKSDAAALIVACFSDPGVPALRSMMDVPVIGIQEAAVSVSLTLGARFGIVAILLASVERQRTAMMAQGLTDRWAGSLPLGLGVADLADPSKTLDRLIEVANKLRETRDADVIILGCAGMGRYRREIEAAMGLPVVDPVQAAATIAVGRVLTGHHPRAK